MLLTEVLVTTIILHVGLHCEKADDSDLGYFVNCPATGMLKVTLFVSKWS